jgi:tetratricopeptide (TPR) repeat protein
MPRWHPLVISLALVPALALAVPLRAQGSATIFGTSAARACYEAAETGLTPRAADFRICDAALQDVSTPPREVVASFVNRGIMFLRTGNIDAALADFDRATQLDAEEPEAYLNRGTALLKRGRVRSALEMFDQALGKNTSRPELAHYGRAIAHEALGNARAAYRDYLRASEIAPQWAQPRAELARFRVAPD